MKALNTVVLYLIVAIAIVASFFIDLFEEIRDSEWTLFVIAILCITSATFVLLFCFIYYDVPGLIDVYYQELCSKLTLKWPT